MKKGFLDSSDFLPSAISTARASRRTFFSCLVSPLYLLRRRKSWVAVFLSSVCANWAIAGGTLRRWWRMTFWRCRRTYSGHLTKRVRSVTGWIDWPARGQSCAARRRERTDTKVLGGLLEEGVLLRGGRLGPGVRSGRNLLSRLDGGFGLQGWRGRGSLSRVVKGFDAGREGRRGKRGEYSQQVRCTLARSATAARSIAPHRLALPRTLRRTHPVQRAHSGSPRINVLGWRGEQSMGAVETSGGRSDEQGE